MFTGIIETCFRVCALAPAAEGLRMQMELHQEGEWEKTWRQEVRLGDSIALNGVCLTVEEIDRDQNSWQFFVGKSTLEKTNFASLQAGDLVNMEPAMTMQSKVNGHFVQGHVHCTAKILSIIKQGENHLITYKLDPELAPLLIREGSIAIDGISLTVYKLNDKEQSFTVCIIPHTWSVTNLHRKAAGDRVNLEPDMVAKYVQRLLQYPHQ